MRFNTTYRLSKQTRSLDLESNVVKISVVVKFLIVFMATFFLKTI